MVAKAAKDSSKKLSSQGKAFIKAAREYGASENEAVFDRNLKRIAKAKPAQKAKPKATGY